jgi:phenylacetate-CoA ligase
MLNPIKIIPTSLIHKIITHQMKDYDSFRDNFLNLDPDLVELLREKYLIYSFKKNATRIPQYKEFMKKKKIKLTKIDSIENFKSLPETNKHNYVYKAKDISQLCIDGNYKNINLLVKSSGHSGRQCYWAKSHKENLFGETCLTIAFDEEFSVHKKKTLIINGFILGSWVTGINFNEVASKHCPIINVGPKEDEILSVINDIGKDYQQIIITGYPPFISDLVSYAEKEKFNWKNYKVFFIGGGEGFSESWRNYIESKTGALVRSGFGASDIGILAGMENKDTVFIRRFAEKNSNFKKQLFGEIDEVPMIFQIPLNLYVYPNKNQELIFTTILPEAVQPCMNYNLEDKGYIISYKNMQAVLKKYKITKKFTLPLPFMCIAGRTKGPIKFYAFFIYPENIEDCIYKTSIISRTSTGNFRMNVLTNKDFSKTLEISFELKAGVLNSVSLQKEYTDNIFNILKNVNQGYAAICQKRGIEAIPKIILYDFDKYPFKSKIKNIYS